MKQLLKYLIAGAVLVGIVTGCRTNDSLGASSESERRRAAQSDMDVAVYKAGIEAGQTILASRMFETPDDGFRAVHTYESIARDTAGEVTYLTNPDGSYTVFPEKSSMEAAWTSNFGMPQQGKVDKLSVIVGETTESKEGTNEVYTTAPRYGGLLHITVEGFEGAVGPDASVVQVRVQARVAEREVILKGLTELEKEKWIGRGKVIELLGDGLVKVTTAVGDAIVGRLISATPTGAGVEAMRIAVKDESGVLKTLVLDADGDPVSAGDG